MGSFRPRVVSVATIRDTTGAPGMSDLPAGHLTQLLQHWTQGDQGALDRLVAEVYPELRLMASRYMRGGRAGTIQATTCICEC